MADPGNDFRPVPDHKKNISLHIRNILAERERDNSVVKEYLTTAVDRKNYRTLYYNLDIVLALGYRVRSHRGTQIRRWETDLSPGIPD